MHILVLFLDIQYIYFKLTTGYFQMKLYASCRAWNLAIIFPSLSPHPCTIIITHFILHVINPTIHFYFSLNGPLSFKEIQIEYFIIFVISSAHCSLRYRFLFCLHKTCPEIVQIYTYVHTHSHPSMSLRVCSRTPTDTQLCRLSMPYVKWCNVSI